MKEFLREGLFVAASVLLLAFLADQIKFPATSELIFSPTAILFALFVLLLPFFPSVLAGFWIKRKTESKTKSKAYMFVPAFGAIVGGVLLIVFSLLQIFLTSDSNLLIQIQQLQQLYPSFYGLSVSDFRSFALTSSFVAAVIITIINGVLGVIGGFLGGIVARKSTNTH